MKIASEIPIEQKRSSSKLPTQFGDVGTVRQRRPEAEAGAEAAEEAAIGRILVPAD
jgi:hypothetical protein